MVHVQTDGHLLTLTISRPDRKNALTQEMYGTLAEGILSAKFDKNIRAILIRGDEDFTAGNDLADFVTIARAGIPIRETQTVRFIRAVMSSEKPLIAAVKGLAIGIGTTLLMHCDAVVAGEHAQFSVPFAQLGLVPEFGASYLLPHIAGATRARYYLLSGEKFDAPTALSMGLVTHVVSDDDVYTRGVEVAQQLAHLSSITLHEIKSMLKPIADKKTLEAVVEGELTVFESYLRRPAFQEAVTAFYQKRKPDFLKVD